MKMRVSIAAFLVCLSWVCVCLAQNTAKSSTAKAQSKPASATHTPGGEGERLFKVNCARCHNPPEAISPREAAAVVRHMRVRAMLSAEDEKELLQFIAP